MVCRKLLSDIILFLVPQFEQLVCENHVTKGGGAGSFYRGSHDCHYLVRFPQWRVSRLSLEVWVEGFITICVYICIVQCVHTGKCVYMYICRCFVGSPRLQFHLSLFSVHSVIDGERNAAHQCSPSSMT